MNDRIVKKGEDARQGEVVRDPGEPRHEDEEPIVTKGQDARQGEILGRPKDGDRRGEPIAETTEEARQGETWAPMQRVLFGGIALVVIAFAILLLVFAL